MDCCNDCLRLGGVCTGSRVRHVAFRFRVKCRYFIVVAAVGVGRGWVVVLHFFVFDLVVVEVFFYITHGGVQAVAKVVDCLFEISTKLAREEA